MYVMSSVCSYVGVVIPQWRRASMHESNKFDFWVFLLHSKKKIRPFRVSSALSDDHVPAPIQTRKSYDQSEEFFGLSSQRHPSLSEASVSDAIKPRSWFGPNGQYIRELPCPSCRGRGYTLCTECGIERSRKDCAQCDGKGMNTCEQCKGDRVIWEESIDERPWEKARSISPFKVREDDVVDNLELNLKRKRISKRVYQSSPPEVNLKISRSLKSLNARTGLFSNRMKIIHGDPMLHAQRVAAIKKAKGTADARKHASETMKDYFRDPENRRKRSISMKGIKFYCKNCGCEGHRKHYCPKLKDNSTDRRFKCRLCGKKGHNRRTCPASRSNEPGNKITRNHRCRECGLIGHNIRTCQQNRQEKVATAPIKDFITIAKRTYTCRLCLKKGHNIRTCQSKNVLPLNL
nr:PREDICTED: uncharacterized protein LOC108202348 [Daucus carota subsp. sativus]